MSDLPIEASGPDEFSLRDELDAMEVSSDPVEARERIVAGLSDVATSSEAMSIFVAGPDEARQIARAEILSVFEAAEVVYLDENQNHILSEAVSRAVDSHMAERKARTQ